MCGIVGYCGPKSVDSVLIVGLLKLEYRGYDSAGIAAISNQEITIAKEKGRIADLEKSLRHLDIRGHVGIGHTRWATHGEPSKRNAHPHTNMDETLAVVHNGIIENYLELKQELQKKGYVFESETDTEVIPHLIDDFLKQGMGLKDAFWQTLQKLKGKYAVAMVCEREPNRIYFARNGAPLIVAVGDHRGEKEYLLASDIPALVPLAKFAYYLRDGEWGYFENGIFLFNFQNEPINFHLEAVTIKAEEIDKGNYPHFMLKEIYEQPEIMRRILRRRLAKGDISFEELRLSKEFLSRLGKITIQASGTSLHAGMVAKLYFEQNAHIETNADYSSEFRYRNPVVGGDTLVVGISQSGETADTLAGIHEAKAKFLKVLSFVNNLNSTIARESDGIIDLMAGPEIGVASTKAYTAELLNLYLFSLYLAQLRWRISEEEKKQIFLELQNLPGFFEEILQNQKNIQPIAEYLKDKNSVLFLGRTYNHPTALEGALKLKEISYIHAEGYAAGEFKHGPIALVSPDVPVIVIAPQGEMRAKMFSNLQEAKARKGKIISVITKGDQEIAEISDFVLEIPPIREELSPLLAVLPLQLLAYHTALLRGCDVDKPRNLAKSVTVE